MIVYRIAPRAFAKDISGIGAAMHPGRWNQSGVAVLYTGINVEIALLEMLVHLPSGMTPPLDLLTIQIPDQTIEKITAEKLPDNWQDYPAPGALSEIGNAWVKSERSLALQVPSAIVATSAIIILNCRHPKYKSVRIIKHEPFPVDLRLIK